MKTNYPACRAFVRKYEGGFSLVRSDPGNWTGGKVGVGVLKGTKYGIAANSHPHLDIVNLTMEHADAIFYDEYAKPIGFDTIPAGPDLCTFDEAVTSGPRRALERLRKAREGSSGNVETVHKMCAARLSFMRGLAAWTHFGKGWNARVVACEALAVKMAGASATQIKVAVETARSTATKATTKATGAGAGGGGVVAVTDTHTALWFSVAVGVAAIAGVAYFVWRSRAETARADALELVEKEV